jgi:hypothetical protein
MRLLFLQITFVASLFLVSCGTRPQAQSGSFGARSADDEKCSSTAPSLSVFSGVSPEFQPHAAYAALWLSQIIELPEGGFWKRLGELYPEDVRVVTRGGLGHQAVLFRVDGRIFVVFGGTKDVVDYFDDALIAPSSGEPMGLPGKVHKGFLANFKAIWDDVYAAAIDMGAKNLGVWVMGHSLGGVLSQFAAYAFLQQNIDVKGVWGSGVPLPGNSEYQKQYNAALGRKTFVVVFENDLTPNVPPSPEAADAFADVVERPLRELARTLARRLDYQQVGNWLFLSSQGEVLPISHLANYQVAFYNKMRADNAKLTLPRLLLFNRIYSQSHETERYRCAMLEHVSRM